MDSKLNARIASLVDDIFFAFKDVFREKGSKTLTPLQQTVIDNVLAFIGDPVFSVVKEQLQHPFKCPARHKGRLNPIYFRHLDRLPLIDNPMYQDCLYKVHLKVENRRYVAKVTFYGGRIFSTEFGKPAAFFEGKIATVTKVELGKVSDSFAHAVDRLEHGKNGTAATGE